MSLAALIVAITSLVLTAAVFTEKADFLGHDLLDVKDSLSKFPDTRLNELTENEAVLVQLRMTTYYVPPNVTICHFGEPRDMTSCFCCGIYEPIGSSSATCDPSPAFACPDKIMRSLQRKLS